MKNSGWLRIVAGVVSGLINFALLVYIESQLNPIIFLTFAGVWAGHSFISLVLDSWVLDSYVENPPSIQLIPIGRSSLALGASLVLWSAAAAFAQLDNLPTLVLLGIASSIPAQILVKKLLSSLGRKHEVVLTSIIVFESVVRAVLVVILQESQSIFFFVLGLSTNLTAVLLIVLAAFLQTRNMKIIEKPHLPKTGRLAVLVGHVGFAGISFGVPVFLAVLTDPEDLQVQQFVSWLTIERSVLVYALILLLPIYSERLFPMSKRNHHTVKDFIFFAAVAGMAMVISWMLDAFIGDFDPELAFPAALSAGPMLLMFFLGIILLQNRQLKSYAVSWVLSGLIFYTSLYLFLITTSVFSAFLLAQTVSLFGFLPSWLIHRESRSAFTISDSKEA